MPRCYVCGNLIYGNAGIFPVKLEGVHVVFARVCPQCALNKYQHIMVMDTDEGAVLIDRRTQMLEETCCIVTVR